MGLTDAYEIGNRLLAHRANTSKPFDLLYLACRDLGHPVACTKDAAVTCPTLRMHVLDVVPLRADEQMRWVAASRVVAFVKDVMPLWDRPYRQHVGDPMRGGARALEVHGSIAAKGARLAPRPA